VGTLGGTRDNAGGSINFTVLTRPTHLPPARQAANRLVHRQRCQGTGLYNPGTPYIPAVAGNLLVVRVIQRRREQLERQQRLAVVHAETRSKLMEPGAGLAGLSGGQVIGLNVKMGSSLFFGRWH